MLLECFYHLIDVTEDNRISSVKKKTKIRHFDYLARVEIVKASFSVELILSR